MAKGTQIQIQQQEKDERKDVENIKPMIILWQFIRKRSRFAGRFGILRIKFHSISIPIFL
jgi:hypothetical protein